ncbi:hypothetical protein BVX95_02010 [archaeon D22]|nr:hypothetical protein BVX95_02010 [archaeon D22]
MGNKNKLPDVFDTDQLVQLFDSMNNIKVATASFLAFFCGLRISEVCNLETSNVDLNRKVLKVVDSKNTNRGKQGGYGKDRYIPIPDPAIDILRDWITLIQGGKWLFPSDKSPNQPMTKKNLDEKFRASLRNAGLLIHKEDLHFTAKITNPKTGKKEKVERTIPRYKYHFHNLRHSYATYLLNKGVNIVAVKDLLGHERFDTTLVYAKLAHSKKAEEVNNAFNVQMRQHVIPQQEVAQLVPPQPSNLNPLAKLQDLMVSGKITAEEYQQRLSLLQSSLLR